MRLRSTWPCSSPRIPSVVLQDLDVPKLGTQSVALLLTSFSAVFQAPPKADSGLGLPPILLPPPSAELGVGKLGMSLALPKVSFLLVEAVPLIYTLLCWSFRCLEDGLGSLSEKRNGRPGSGSSRNPLAQMRVARASPKATGTTFL